MAACWTPLTHCVVGQVLDHQWPVASLELATAEGRDEVRVALEVALRLCCLALHRAAIEATQLCKVRHETEPVAGGNIASAYCIEEVRITVRVAFGVTILACHFPPLPHSVLLLMFSQSYPIARDDVVLTIAFEQVNMPVRIALESIFHIRFR